MPVTGDKDPEKNPQQYVERLMIQSWKMRINANRLQMLRPFEIRPHASGYFGITFRQGRDQHQVSRGSKRLTDTAQIKIQRFGCGSRWGRGCGFQWFWKGDRWSATAIHRCKVKSHEEAPWSWEGNGSSAAATAEGPEKVKTDKELQPFTLTCEHTPTDLRNWRDQRESTISLSPVQT